jgi:hypothetical protein
VGTGHTVVSVAEQAAADEVSQAAVQEASTAVAAAATAIHASLAAGGAAGGAAAQWCLHGEAAARSGMLALAERPDVLALALEGVLPVLVACREPPTLAQLAAFAGAGGAEGTERVRGLGLWRGRGGGIRP